MQLSPYLNSNGQCEDGCTVRYRGFEMTVRSSVGSLVLLAVMSAARVQPTEPPPALLAFTCAKFPGNSSEADLIARYGREHVIDAKVFGSDDGPQDGTVLFAGTDDARLEIVWQNAETKSSPRWIKAVGRRWTTAGRVTIGTSLRTVERLNRAPFRLAGFQTEMQGVVRSWGKGRLAQLTRTEGCDVRIHFQPEYDGNAPVDVFRQVRSGREYSSGHPALQRLNPRVAVIWLTYSLRP